MKITLINLPSPALAEPWTNFPLGLGYVAASLDKRNYDVQIADCSNISNETYLKASINMDSRIYGMSITTPQLGFAKVLAAAIKKESPKAIVVAGGPHTLVGKEDFFKDKNFDSVVIEEGEFSMYELVRHYQLYGEVEQVYWNPPIKLLDDVPFPARHLFPDFKNNCLKTKQLLKGDYTDGGQTTIIASRGCPYRCSFCAPHSRRVRFRSPDNVIAEIREILDRFDVRQFKWQDDTFTLNRKWILELCDKIKKQLPKIYQRAHTRVNVFDEEMAKAMRDANFKLLCFGIESFSQKVLDINNKAITIDMIEDSLKLAKKYGFKTVGFLIFGMPGEDPQTVGETKAGILRNKRYLDYLNLATMVPLIGTPVYNNPEQFGCEIINKNFDDFWIVDHDQSDEVLVKTNGISIDTMKKLKREMYQFMRDEGYSRPEWGNGDPKENSLTSK
jgi:radical SAM superfamily enzyme YgiQ (UPF0313 family)